MWVYVILLGLLGLGLDAAFRVLNRRLFHWAETAR
jgi:ABC-type nitrate/sulfonate/bicarbonate transport system permease component